LKPNETKLIEIPKLFDGQIYVSVKINNPKPFPESIIDIEISSSGNGYLWIFENIEENTFEMRYPSSEHSNNQIFAEKTFSFPDSNDMALFSGTEAKVESYIVIVTSVQDSNYAKDLLQLITGTAIIDKGTIQKKRMNWGASSFSYEVSKL
jgi:hypothetical protein